jgi:hypothetical protein
LVSAGGISAEVPEAWNEDRGGPWEDGQTGGHLAASEDLDGFVQGWGAAEGVSISVFEIPGLTPEDVLDNSALFSICTHNDRWEYVPGNLARAVWDRFLDCGGTSWMSFNVAAAPADGSYVVAVQFRLSEDPGPRMVEHVSESITYEPGA